MDKSWMSKDRFLSEYKDGVEYFIQFDLESVANSDILSCPYSTCGNMKTKKIDRVGLHLMANGTDLTYHKWICHEERSAHSENDFNQPDDGENNYMYENPIDMVHVAYEETDNPKEFIKLLEDADEPLYPGCVKFTKLSTILKLYNLKDKYGWTDSSVNSILTLMKDMLPGCNQLSLCLYDSKNVLTASGMDYVKIHACHNDCVLHRKAYEASTSCSSCGTSRWKIGRNSTLKNLVHVKVLWYFSPIPRFQIMFRNKEVSNDLTWHAEEMFNDDYLCYPTDSPSWKVVDHRWPEFAS